MFITSTSPFLSYIISISGRRQPFSTVSSSSLVWLETSCSVTQSAHLQVKISHYIISIIIINILRVSPYQIHANLINSLHVKSIQHGYPGIIRTSQSLFSINIPWSMFIILFFHCQEMSNYFNDCQLSYCILQICEVQAFLR